MAKGGARAQSGPPPDPNALRRDRDGDQWETLPAEGRKGNPPAWPLAAPKREILRGDEIKLVADSAAAKRERELWKREWRRPQAVMWERLGLEVEVALYVRSVVAAERADAPVAARTLVRQQQESLGISLPGLARNRWRIGTPVAEQRAARPARSGPSARERFRVVDGGG
jgi:hypothetical protein